MLEGEYILNLIVDIKVSLRIMASNDRSAISIRFRWMARVIKANKVMRGVKKIVDRIIAQRIKIIHSSIYKTDALVLSFLGFGQAAECTDFWLPKSGF